MLVPLDWLQEYVELDVDAKTLASDLTMFGTKIESVHVQEPGFRGVVVGRVLDRSQHPSADKLSLCTVDVAGETLRIVCGAANVRAGLTVAVARVGARLAGNVKIRKSKIRGEVSEGMICSAAELGLGVDSDGILELDTELENGIDFATVVHQAPCLDAEITPNRPDCLGLFGIAREVAALYQKPLRSPSVWKRSETLEPTACPVRIESESDCRRYLGRCIRDVRVGPSPDWLQERLRSVGLVPINNIVDITNFVLFETGQPLHAFDLDKLRGPGIVVRRARAGERLKTLDGVDRTLDPDLLVIADDERPVALAGILGGAETAVGNDTRHVLLESAFFDPAVVRSGRRKLGLQTDAAYRFEREADPEAALWAADRATRLLVEHADARVRETEADVYPGRAPAPVVRVRVERANRLVGMQLGTEEAAGLLRRLMLPAEPEGSSVAVQVPSFRRDLHAEVDLVEELARVYGYDRIEGEVLRPSVLRVQEEPRDVLIARLRDFCMGLGFFEAKTSAFMERDDPDRLGLPEDDPRRQVVRIRNPIVTGLGTMRTSLLPGLLRVARHNLHHDQTPIRFQQIDRVFLDRPGPRPELPSEPEKLVLLGSGPARPLSWAEDERPFDLGDLKGPVESLFDHLHVDTSWTYGYTEPFLEDSTSFLISGTYGVIGNGGRIRDEVRNAFHVEPEVFVFELDLDALEKHLPDRPVYRGVPRTPAVKRDLSLVVPEGVPYEAIREAIVRAGGRYLESVVCFDVFEGAPLGVGERGLGIRLRFRSPQETLTEADVTPALDKIVERLTKKLQVHLRAG